jgi:hypothetical protein
MSIFIIQLMPSVFGDGAIIVLPDAVGPVDTPYSRTALRNSDAMYLARKTGPGAYDPDRRWGSMVRLAAAPGNVEKKEKRRPVLIRLAFYFCPPSLGPSWATPNLSLDLEPRT